MEARFSMNEQRGVGRSALTTGYHASPGKANPDPRHCVFQPGSVLIWRTKKKSPPQRASFLSLASVKRMARLTLAFSKRLENLKAALALHIASYNFCKVHGSLRCTPGMEAGVTTKVWEISDLLPN